MRDSSAQMGLVPCTMFAVWAATYHSPSLICIFIDLITCLFSTVVYSVMAAAGGCDASHALVTRPRLIVDSSFQRSYRHSTWPFHSSKPSESIGYVARDLLNDHSCWPPTFSGVLTQTTNSRSRPHWAADPYIPLVIFVHCLLLSRRSQHGERLYAMGLSICLSVCLVVSLTPKCKTRFSRKLSNLQLRSLLTT